MPLLKIQTNQSLDAERRARLLEAASRDLAEILGKPERYIMVILECNPDMRFAGSDEPLAYLELKSIGLPEGRTTELSQALCGLIGKHADVPAERIYIEFSDAARHLWGWNSGTF